MKFIILKTESNKLCYLSVRTREDLLVGTPHVRRLVYV